MWRPIISDPKLASLEEIERDWSIDDLYDSHEILDTIEAIREIEKKEAENK